MEPLFKDSRTPPEAPRLYRDLADWYPLLTPLDDYAEEALFYHRLFETHCRRKPQTLLDLGCGGGHNAAHLKTAFACTLVDVEPAMLSLSSRLNPECEHLPGDMRSLRLGRLFDCVLLHDAVSYMATRADLASAIATAFAHTAPGGVALFQPDFVFETFEEGTESGGSDREGRGLRYLEWRWLPEGSKDRYVTDMAYMMRDEKGKTTVIHDRHVMGLFPRSLWLGLIEAAGFLSLAVPFSHPSWPGVGTEIFLGLKPTKKDGPGSLPCPSEGERL